MIRVWYVLPCSKIIIWIKLIVVFKMYICTYIWGGESFILEKLLLHSFYSEQIHWDVCVIDVAFETNICSCFLKRYIMFFKLMITNNWKKKDKVMQDQKSCVNLKFVPNGASLNEFGYTARDHWWRILKRLSLKDWTFTDQVLLLIVRQYQPQT